MTDGPGTDDSGRGEAARSARFWRANIALLVKLLLVWFLVSYGAGILFVEQLNAFSFMGYPLGFWFAQQGSIYVFVVLIFVYARGVARLERAYHDAGRSAGGGEAA